MKKVIYLLVVLVFIFMISLYWFQEQAGAELESNKTEEIRQGDYILHIRVENSDEHFQVFRSIQYVGDDPVTINHQTPLVSVSFKQRNHDYTGSTVNRILNMGDSYHPQNAKTFELPEQGTHKLYAEAVFEVDGEEIKINYEEKLLFQ